MVEQVPQTPALTIVHRMATGLVMSTASRISCPQPGSTWTIQTTQLASLRHVVDWLELSEHSGAVILINVMYPVMSQDTLYKTSFDTHFRQPINFIQDNHTDENSMVFRIVNKKKIS